VFDGVTITRQQQIDDIFHGTTQHNKLKQLQTVLTTINCAAAAAAAAVGDDDDDDDAECQRLLA